MPRVKQEEDLRDAKQRIKDLKRSLKELHVDKAADLERALGEALAQYPFSYERITQRYTIC